MIGFLIPPDTGEAPLNSVVAGRAGDLKPNSGASFKFNSRPGLLLRTAGGELRAFAATCTHLDCTVQYRGDVERIWCACHDGHYDLHGATVSGPPPRPLEQYVVNVQGEDVVVSRKADRRVLSRSFGGGWTRSFQCAEPRGMRHLPRKPQRPAND